MSLAGSGVGDVQSALQAHGLGCPRAGAGPCKLCLPGKHQPECAEEILAGRELQQYVKAWFMDVFVLVVSFLCSRASPLEFRLILTEDQQ
jgi:hypothetical protein